ncbi:MAG: hypothetical protein HY331_07525 [Chloroflexi bacterium]|nr:hypothetical protein [Chloroflexota bacterium]
MVIEPLGFLLRQRQDPPCLLGEPVEPVSAGAGGSTASSGEAGFPARSPRPAEREEHAGQPCQHAVDDAGSPPLDGALGQSCGKTAQKTCEQPNR